MWALGRTSGTEANGFGTVTTLEFIVEDDLAGIKSTSGIVPFTIELDGAQGMSVTGETFSMPGTRVTMYIDYGNQEVPFSADRLTIWPNPSRGVFNAHLNGQEEMLAAQLYASDGRLIRAWDGIDPDRQRFVVSPDLVGTYILRIQTTAGVVSKKIQLIGQ